MTCGAGAQVFVQRLFSVRSLLRAAGTSLRFLLVVLSDEDASLNLAWSFKSPASAHAHTVPLFFLWVVGHTAGWLWFLRYSLHNKVIPPPSPHQSLMCHMTADTFDIRVNVRVSERL